MVFIFRKILRIQSKNDIDKSVVHKTVDLETSEEYKSRWRSLRITYFSMFVLSMMYFVAMAGVWPYLNKLDPTADKEFLGIAISAVGLGQMVFSILAGYWITKVESSQIPLVVFLLISIVASSGYALLEVFPTNTNRYWMVFFRFFIGASVAINVICRSYIADSTTLQERTVAINSMGLCLTIGSLTSNALQGAMTVLGDDGLQLFGGVLSLNMYTVTIWINVLISVTNLVLITWPGLFGQYPIAAREVLKQKTIETKEHRPWIEPKRDYIAIWSIIAIFFVVHFSVFESLGTSMVMDQFAWSREETLQFMTLLMTVGNVVNIIAIIVLRRLCRRFDERSLLLNCGFTLMILGSIICIPFGTNPPQLMTLDDAMNVVNGTALGCPVDVQSWCATTPSMTIIPMIIGFMIIRIGRSFSMTLCQTIFSKVLGHRPQGVWIGVIMTFVCLARIVSPIMFSTTYVRLGPIWTFFLAATLNAVCAIWLYLVRARLVPPHIKSSQESKKSDVDTDPEVHM